MCSLKGGWEDVGDTTTTGNTTSKGTTTTTYCLGAEGITWLTARPQPCDNAPTANHELRKGNEKPIAGQTRSNAEAEDTEREADRERSSKDQMALRAREWTKDTYS